MCRLTGQAIAVMLLLGGTASAADRVLDVDAAASLSDVLPKIAAAWKASGGTDVRFNFDATSRLAQQVKAGAHVDVFFSADEAWMDELSRAGLVDTRVDLLGNELVLVTAPGANVGSLEALREASVKHVALAGENVPAGKYARAALKSLGLWEAVAPKVVNATNVRQALTLAANGEVEAAFVYRTDALAEPRVKLVAAIPASATPPIVYPAAVLAGARPEARSFFSFCRSPAARKAFESAGFRVLAKED